MKRTDETDEGRPDAIGGAIRALREARGMRQGDLAKRTGMSAAQVCRIEKDRHAPSVRTLRRIADALGVPLADLAAGEASPANAAPVRASAPRPPEESDFLSAEEAPVAYGATRDDGFFESLRPVGAVSPADLPAAARSQVRRLVLEYRELERRANVPTTPSLPLDYPAEIGTEDADALARSVRRAAGIADAVLFDSVNLLENKGLRVVPADLPEAIDAFALWDGAARNVWLVLRRNATDERQQFRAACALADTLRFVAGGARRPVADTPWNKRFAKAFAASFLMPEGALRELCYRLGLRDDSWTWDLLLREKHRYGVSAETFALRLEELELLRPALRQRLVRRIREWKEAHGGAEPNPSARKVLRHSRFSDLKMLVRPAEPVDRRP